MTRGSERRGQTWMDDVRGGLSAIVLEALIVAVLAAVAVGIAFLAVTVV